MSIDGGPRNVDETLDRVRGELADEVAADVRVPPFAGVVARRARRRRMQMTAGAAAVLVVAAGVVGGVAATRPGAHRSVPPAATVSVSPEPTASATAAPSDAQTYPAKGSSYVVVPDGDQLAWTDLKTGAHGHFGPADGGQLSDPSVSADGRQVAYARQLPTGTSVAVWNLDTRRATVVAGPGQLSTPAISPDGETVVWFQQGAGIRWSGIGGTGAGPTPFDLAPNANQATWDGSGAVAYLPEDAKSGGLCAVERLDISGGSPVSTGAAHHASASATRGGTRCLLPTATLQSVFAPDGSTWRIDKIAGSADGSLLALQLSTAGGASSENAIGVLDPGAEATPFRVLPSTVATVVNKMVTDPAIIDDGSRLLYVEAPGTDFQGPARGTVVSLDVSTGRRTTVATNGTAGGGLGATSG